MRVLVATTQVPFVRGGAEILADGLCDALRRAGHEAEIVRFPFKWYPPGVIAAQVLATRLMDLSAFSGTGIDILIGLEFPAYCIPHPRRRHWLVHQHRAAYDLWDAGVSDLLHAPAGRSARDFIREADSLYLREAEAVYTISHNVSDRLRRYVGLDAKPLYHPPKGAEFYRAGAFGDYLLFPSRMDAIKRQWLAIDALAQTVLPVRLVFVGRGDNPATMAELRARAHKRGVDDRIRWDGEVSDARKVDLYAGATAVVYPPLDEDYGYVTLEAMLAGKPVITCSDSGGPLEFIEDGVGGMVVEPAAAALAKAMDALWDDRGLASQLGRQAREVYSGRGIGWEAVVSALTADASAPSTGVS